MRALIRKVAENVNQAWCERLTKPCEHVTERAAIGTEVIAIKDDAGRGFALSAAHVIADRIDVALKARNLANDRGAFLSHRRFVPRYGAIVDSGAAGVDLHRPTVGVPN